MDGVGHDLYRDLACTVSPGLRHPLRGNTQKKEAASFTTTEFYNMVQCLGIGLERLEISNAFPVGVVGDKAARE
jgi:hypothetical protein